MRFLFFLLMIFIHAFVDAQQFSIFIGPGIMNYAGDLQTSSYTFSQSNICIAAGLNYQVNHFSINAAFTAGSVEGNDKYSAKNSNRNLNFKSGIVETSIALQYDIIDISDAKKITPYIFAGAGIIRFNPYTYDIDGIKTYLQPIGTEGQGLPEYSGRNFYSLFEFCLPVGGGLKYKINDKFTACLEYNTRFLNTDYLDDVSKSYPDQQVLLNARGVQAVRLSFREPEIDPSAVFPEKTQRGNPKKKDNFYTTGLKFSYTIPRVNRNSSYTKSGNIRCPRKVY